MSDDSVKGLIGDYDKYVVKKVSEPFPIIFTRGEGGFLTDISGKRYLDFWAGIATVSAGHNNPEVQDAVKRQMDQLVHCASWS